MTAHIYRDELAPRLEARRSTTADDLERASGQLINAAQILRIVEAGNMDEEDSETLRRTAQNITSDALKPLNRHLVQTGVADIVYDHRTTIASKLQVSDLPQEDLAALRRSGSTDPWADLELSIERLRLSIEAGKGYDEARLRYDDAVEEAMKELHPSPPGAATQNSTNRGRRRWFKAIGQIVKGAVLMGVDGTLVAVGVPISAANPAVAAGVVGSLAIGFNDLASGVGDLRGE